MHVDIFIPCFIDQFFPDTGFNMIKLLEYAGCTTHYNPNQTCCGQPSYNAGYVQETHKLADKFLSDFAGDTVIVSPGGSCTGFVKNNYASLFESPEQKSKARNLGKRIYDITDFLVNVLHVTDFKSVFPYKVTVHTSCSALREYGLAQEPFILLQNVSGIELVELPDAEVCCGFGGTFS
ncbi:MAG: (Fe-S)-binding protein, partial [Bacteroidales bacterium]